MPLIVYCEHGAMNRAIRRMARDRLIELVHFPYDPDSRSRHVQRLAVPSAAQIRDLHLPINELPGRISDYDGSAYLDRILAIVGAQHRRDALHLDSAVKTGCGAFITGDTDILSHRPELEVLLPLRILHPDDAAGLAAPSWDGNSAAGSRVDGKVSP